MNVCKSSSIFLSWPKTAHRVHRPTSKEPTRVRYTEGSRKNTKHASSSHAVTSWTVLLIALSRCRVSTSGLVAWVPCLICCRRLNMSKPDAPEAPALSEASISAKGSTSVRSSDLELGPLPGANSPFGYFEDDELALTRARWNRSCSSGDHTESSTTPTWASGFVGGDGAKSDDGLLVVGPGEGETDTREGVGIPGLPESFERNETSVHNKF